MIDKEKCPLCHAKGKRFINGGYTKADLIECDRCCGTGEVAVGAFKKQKSVRNRTNYSKLLGLPELKKIEAI
jgi:hypothetical protein